jgi:hypothetical protein
VVSLATSSSVDWNASGWVVLGIWQAVYPTIQAELFPASVHVVGIGFAHQIVIAVFGGTAPLIAAAFVGAGQPMYVVVYMIAIVSLSLIVYFTLPETGSRAGRATVAPADPEVLEGERLLAETAHGGIQAKGSKP